MADPKPKLGCLVQIPDVASAKGRDPFAGPGRPGNRWLSYGCDASIPSAYLTKLNSAVLLAYDLADRQNFTQNFVKVVSTVSSSKVAASAYLDSLNTMIVSFAELSNNPMVIQEIADESEAVKQDKSYLPPGGFTKRSTGQVWIREFVLKSWTEKQVAGLLSHEATHVAGAPGDMITELILASLYPPEYASPSH